MTSTMTNGVTLLSWRCGRIGLDAACEAVFTPGSADTIAVLAYTVNACHLGALRYTDEQRLAVFDGGHTTALAPEGAYEVRIFNQQRELRWVRDPRSDQGAGTAVLVCEEGAAPSDAWMPIGSTAESEMMRDVVAMEGRQLLWGTVLSTTADQVTLYTARIGKLTLPAELLPGAAARDDRIALISREYVAFEPLHGNAYVCEERLMRFEVATRDTLEGG